jgi:hypothetical protein
VELELLRMTASSEEPTTVSTEQSMYAFIEQTGKPDCNIDNDDGVH